MIKRKENPAKQFLLQYISLSGRVDALTRAINDAMERAWNTGVSIKEIKVLSSPAEHDPMASDICDAVDATETLREYKAKADTVLRDILTAIDSVQDERQKLLLTLRYINGLNFKDIKETMHYEETQIFVIHGRALVEINKWLERRRARVNE